ncbi:putidacin L1 family lectin-like bacteriocin [Pseudomonas sp. DTU_2021_1001937_2_SI_NGA_ILE_001]|uniref:putidacin L1 family lectin-like bacteriocin n=1 Tax=Pseudomonas sp. DTU_2021_1001937_2_SI_NGA_ILE_001 TaxID=3077589 RepID=UPI0028FC1B02|nr:putidacin L1 family lectin-like bacteriocin [Pseudomonas sp. DTU_2021_1001937_2_SI_NGA_ILE_001]WNW11856.1 putidacin L1 family lectin-like bacteriocin [Pseudomonas sp. DTU_2021_1001937_2_SI_NGA_ILE_001]
MALNLRSLSKNGQSILPPMTLLGGSQYLQSPNGRFKLLAQEDLNLALYDGDSAVWVADASVPYSSQVGMTVRDDPSPMVYMYYNLKLRDGDRRRIWSTTGSDVIGGNLTDAASRTHLQLQDDGNLVIVDLLPLWASNMSLPVAPDIPAVFIQPGTTLHPGDSFAIGSTQLLFQADGNLVVYGAGGVVHWASYTQNLGAVSAVMQPDGNFVIYGAGGVALWNSGTPGQPSAYGRLQADGSFSIVSDRVCWARFGYTPTITPTRTMPRYSGNPYTDPWKTKDFPVWTF